MTLHGSLKISTPYIEKLESGLRLRATIHNSRAAGQAGGTAASIPQANTAHLYETQYNNKRMLKKNYKTTTNTRKLHATFLEKSDYLSILDALLSP